jgi:hypothetical protein
VNGTLSVGLDLMTGLLADDAPRNTGPDFGKASPFGLIVVVLLLIGTFLLVWSMNRHLRKLPHSFDPGGPEADRAVESGTDQGTVGVDPDRTDVTSESPTDGKKRDPGG